MARRIIMSGPEAVYVEHRGAAVPDDDREIRMEGAGARYEEHSAAVAPHFPLAEDREQGMRVYQALINGGFIASDTCEQSWLYVMGYSAVQPSQVRPVEWLKNVQLAREMLETRHAALIESGQLKKSDMERLAVKNCLNGFSHGLARFVSFENAHFVVMIPTTPFYITKC